MAGLPYAAQEYGAAAYSDALNILYPSYSSLNSDSAWQDNFNLHEQELNEFLSILVGADDLNLGRDLLSDHPLSDGWAGALFSMQPMPALPSAPLLSHSPSTLAPESSICDLRRQSILQPSGAQPPSPASPTPMVLQESAICNLQAQVFQRQASLTLFVPPLPPPSKVLHMQCLPCPHKVAQDDLNALHHAEFAFHVDPIVVEGPGLDGDKFMAQPASDIHMQPLACSVESCSIQNALLPHVAQGHEVTESPTAVMEFSSGSASSLSNTDSEQHKHLDSAPVSPSPSVNNGAHPESFQNVDLSTMKTQFYKLNDKHAWIRKHKVGVIKNKMKYSRTSSPAPRPSMDDNANEESTALIRVKTSKLNLDDGYVWRKYGEKVIKNQKYTRNYLRCDEHKRTQCPVRKQTQRSSEDEDYVEFLYVGRHNHLS
ncbi:hypothetical protein GOP47_0027588 [Adiantum capillus-veneris]|nr:hypothetical protein GOP47_0027588 [Adiantum capillus-veneris]